MPPRRSATPTRKSSRKVDPISPDGAKLSPPRSRPGSAGPEERVKSVDPTQHEYVAPVYLNNLDKYKYVGGDLSIIGNNIMQPYWSAVVKLVPMNVAPNLLTLIGFFVSISGTLLTLSFYAYGAPIPNWAWVYVAFSLFAYQTLDAIDGKQARRTGTGSPLGELFDHGCDAFYTPMLQINVCLALGLNPEMTFWTMTIVCTGLYFAIWEQFSTGTLALGYVNGPTDGILIIVGIFLYTASAGVSAWSAPLASPIVIPLKKICSCMDDVTIANLQDGLIVLMIVMAVSTVFTNIVHVAFKPTVRPNKADTFYTVIPILTLWAGYYWLTSLYKPLRGNLLFVSEVAYGLTCSLCATRLTISRLCDMPYSPWNKLTNGNLIVAWGGVAAWYAFPNHQHCTIGSIEIVLPIMCGLAILTYLHLAIALFRQLAEYLGINVLTMTEKQLKALEKKAK